MQIALLGTGKMARGIAYGLRDTAHDLTFGSRDAVKAETLARQMGDENARRYHGTSLESAAARADVVFLALPWSTAVETTRRLREFLDGKILVDLTNPLTDGFDDLVTPPDTSGAELIAEAAGPRVRVVAALKNTFAGTFAEPRIRGLIAPDVLIAGDDPPAKRDVGRLVEAMGFSGLDAGPLRAARTIERMTVLLIDLAMRNRWDWNAGFKIVH